MDLDDAYDNAGHITGSDEYPPRWAAEAEAFRREAAVRWDLARIDAAVRDSQHRRHMVVGALGLGANAPWDYTPPRDAARDYIRNHMDLDDLEARARYPRVRQS